MAENMIEWKINDFIGELASKAPVPGGGGAAALVGAVGVALGNMVGSLTVGKKKYAEVEEEVGQLMEKASRMKGDFLYLMERDAEVFEPLSKAYGLPADTEEQREDKARVMEKCLREASAVPMNIMSLCMEALDVIERFSQIGSKMAVSDAGCAAECCRAALNAASLNVFINTKSMRDRAFAEELNTVAYKMILEGSARAEAIATAVRAQLTD